MFLEEVKLFSTGSSVSKELISKSNINNKFFVVLPVPTSQCTTSASFKFNIYLYYEGTGISIIPESPPIPTKNGNVLKKSLVNKYHKIHTWQNPILKAIEYKDLIVKNGFETQSQLADHLQISRVRVTHYLNLLKLDSSIIDYLSSLKNPSENNTVTERLLRPLTQIKCPQLQKKNFFKRINCS